MLSKDPVVSIGFHFQQKGRLERRTLLKAFLVDLFRKEKTLLASLQYIFCSDDALLTINKDFLQHDYYTDIITFPLSQKGQPVEGEIYISLDRVNDNARKLGEYYNRELHRVIFHGALHLCGYRDKSKKDIVLMRQKEDYYLNSYLK